MPFGLQVPSWQMRTILLLLLLGSSLLCPSADFSQSPTEATSTKPYRINTILRGINGGGIAIGDAEDVYVTDAFRSRIHHIDRSGNATIIAGAGTPDSDLYADFSGPRPRHFGGDGGPAVAAHFDGPHGIVVDSKGDI